MHNKISLKLRIITFFRKWIETAILSHCYNIYRSDWIRVCGLWLQWAAVCNIYWSVFTMLGQMT